MSIIVSEILWAVSPDHCSPYRRLTGDRPPEPPPIPPEPPVEPPDVDPHFFQVVLLVGSESGQNLDESLYHHAGGGNWISTTNAKFGHNSIDPTASGAYIDYGAGNHSVDDEFNISPTQMSEFTIEAWIYLNTIDPATPSVIVGRSFLSVQWGFMTNNTDLRFAYQTLESGFGGHGSFTNIISTGANIQTHRWYHAAVTKDAAKHFRLYLDGVMVGKRTPNDASIDGTEWIDTVMVGQIGFFGTNDWDGQIDELRITKGAARYRTDTHFPVPTRAWPRPPPTAMRSWENASQV